MQSAGWQPSICLDWCLIWLFASLEKHGHTSLSTQNHLATCYASRHSPYNWEGYLGGGDWSYLTLKCPYWDPLWVDKVSMLTHIYTHKPWRNIEVTICNITRLTAYFMWPDVWSADLHLFIKNMVIHDIECPNWDQMSLNNTNQTKPYWDQVSLNHTNPIVYTLWTFPDFSELSLWSQFSPQIWVLFSGYSMECARMIFMLCFRTLWPHHICVKVGFLGRH